MACPGCPGPDTNEVFGRTDLECPGPATEQIPIIEFVIDDLHDHPADVLRGTKTVVICGKLALIKEQETTKE